MISGIYNSLDTFHILSNAKSRSISAENFTGEKGKGGMATEGYCKEQSRELGQKWKVSPCVSISSGKTFTMADITDPGAINHIWMTFGSPENKDERKQIYATKKQYLLRCILVPDSPRCTLQAPRFQDRDRNGLIFKKLQKREKYQEFKRKHRKKLRFLTRLFIF